MNFRNLLVNLGLAVANLGAKYEPTGVAQKLLDAYAKRREQAQLREELDALIAARFDKFREQLAGAMSDDRLQLAGDVRVQIEAYLSQFQASAKQAARALGDPSATTVPATVNLDSAAELAVFLPQRPPRFTVGDTVPGLPSWTLTEPLGSGGFGEVWKAVNPDDDDPVAAFKFFLDTDARTRFTRAEAAALREIHRQTPHDGVVKLRQAEPLADPPWLQFEYIGGGDLSRLPEEWNGLPSASRVKHVQASIRTLAATAGTFHKLGVVHRDLKPSNVLLRKTADGHALVIADFGISKIVRPAGHVRTPSGASLATIRAYTPVYASPQQKRGLSADVRDDVYSLGVLWYQLLRGDFTLERPGGDGWKEVLLNLGVSPADVALLNRCWDDTAERRPADGTELAQSLIVSPPRAKPVSRPAPTSVGSKNGNERVRPSNPTEWWKYGVIAGTLCALALLVIGAFLVVASTALTSTSPTTGASKDKPPDDELERTRWRLERPWLREDLTLKPGFLLGTRWEAEAYNKMDDAAFVYFPSSVEFPLGQGAQCERVQRNRVEKSVLRDGKPAITEETVYSKVTTTEEYSIDKATLLINSNVRSKTGTGPMVKMEVVDQFELKAVVEVGPKETLTMKYTRVVGDRKKP